MVGYKKIKLNDKSAIYDYYPENNKTTKGTVLYHRKNGDMQIIKRSENDLRSVYAWHLRDRLDEFNETGNFRESGYVAWY